MEDLINVVDWSRAQFALTAIYHWLFVPLTLGLGIIVALMETIYFRKRSEKWLATTKFWMLLFGCCFFGSLLVGNIGNQPNNKITKQQDNKNNAYRNLHIGWSFHRSRVRLFMQSEVFP